MLVHKFEPFLEQISTAIEAFLPLYLRGFVASDSLDLKIIKGVFHLEKKHTTKNTTMVNQTTANQLKFISFLKQKVSQLLLVAASFDTPLTQNARG